MKFTVFGASGFIGSHLVAHLRSEGEEVNQAPRNLADLSRKVDLGHVIYAIGMTANFRQKPFSTVDAHISVLSELLRHYNFESLLYLSSARVYQHAVSSKVDAPVPVHSMGEGSIYNISKLAGESLCSSATSRVTRVVRLSNVYGMGMSRSNFLQSVCDSARTTGAVNLTSTLDSSKDYVAISDVTRLLPAIASRGKSKMYNIASGANTSHKRVLRCMQKKIDFELTVTSNASREVFPVIDIEALIHEFGYEPTPFDIGFDSYLRGFNI